jgi:predicted RNase H-like nuclease (RuvC/YqgF family)
MNIDNFEKPENYYTKLNDIKNSSVFLLDEYIKLYVIKSMNPENQEYQQQFSNIDDNVKQITTKLFSISTNIKKNIHKLTEYIISLDNEIKSRRETKKQLNRKLGIVKNETNAASEMIDDYKQIYNERYLRNWALGISIVSGVLVIKWMFKSKPQVV